MSQLRHSPLISKDKFLILSWLNKIKKEKKRVGVEFTSEYLSIAINEMASGKIIASAALDLTETTPKAEHLPLLKNFVEQHNLKKTPCHVVLPARNYQLLLVEKPDVPDNEVRDAVKWKIRDLIQTSIDAVAVDIFALPDDARRTGKEMVYAVVAELEPIRHIIDVVQESGLVLKVIDIEVMALRNLATIKQPERGTAVVRLRAGEADVSIFRSGNLYLSRRFQLNYGGGLLDDLPVDALALEIQRSFDYFERQMGQAPPTILYLCGEGLGPEKITESLVRSLPVPIEFFDLSAQIEAQQADEALAQICVAAIGATYRDRAA